MSAKAVVTSNCHLKDSRQKTGSPLDSLHPHHLESEEDSDIHMV